MSSALRIGILGTGFIAGVHAKSLKQVAGVEVVAVAGREQSRVESFAEEHGIAQRFSDFETMLDSVELDAIYICIAPFAHRGEVESAASRGLHVFLEKPVALDSVHALKIVEAVERAGVKSQVGFQMRFRKSVKVLKRLLESGEAGRPTLFTGRYWVNMEGSEWWRDRARSGGQAFEQVTHLYDLATYLCGEVVTAKGIIRNLCHQDQRDYTIEDTSVGTLAFRNGALGVVTGSNCAIPDHFIGDFRVVCERLTLEYSCTGQPWIRPDSAKLHWNSGKVEVLVEDEDPYLQESQDFVDAIREDRPTVSPARSGLEAIQLIEAVLGDAEV